MPTFRHLMLAGLITGLLLGGSAHLRGYSYTGHRWPGNRVLYYVNPQSVHVSQSAAVSAVQTAAAAWNEQADANIELVYGGTSGASAVSPNSRNDIFFRNASNGSAIAETYMWWNSAGQLVDADIVFYEASFRFFAGSGCTSTGFYIENVGAHEFGHLLGIGHSEHAGVTMAPTVSSGCDRAQLSLEADDLLAVRTIYPPVASAPVTPLATPVAPSHLAAIADAVDPTAAMVMTWQDNASNESGFRIEGSLDGASFVPIGTVGPNVRSFRMAGLWASTVFYFRVSAYNAAGASTYSNVAWGQTAGGAEVGDAVLSARAYLDGGQPSVDLAWSGVPGTEVDVYRNGQLLARVGNVGGGTDRLTALEESSLTYQVCVTGTSVCTNEATVSF